MIFRKQLKWFLAYIWYPFVSYKQKQALMRLGVDKERAAVLVELQLKKHLEKLVLDYSKKGD